MVPQGSGLVRVIPDLDHHIDKNTHLLSGELHLDGNYEQCNLDEVELDTRKLTSVPGGGGHKAVKAIVQ